MIVCEECTSNVGSYISWSKTGEENEYLSLAIDWWNGKNMGRDTSIQSIKALHDEDVFYVVWHIHVYIIDDYPRLGACFGNHDNLFVYICNIIW